MKNNNTKLRVSCNSPVILGFTGICFLSLVMGVITKGVSTNLLFSVYRSSLMDPLTYIRFIGHIFGHAGWEHFIGNIIFILAVWPLLEEKYGQANIFILVAVIYMEARFMTDCSLKIIFQT